jgi:rhamnogalacturonyl hydrolase YesR
LSHLGLLLGGRLPPQVWVDSLFMYGVTLDRLFERRSASWALDEAGRLGRGVVGDLQGPRGLLRHARFEIGGVGLALPVERTAWARGNAWAAYFLADRRRLRRAAGLGPEPALDPARSAMIGPLLDAQDPETGLWPTDLEGGRGENPLETSASGLLVAAFATMARDEAEPLASRLDAAVERGLRGVRSRVRWEGGRPVVVGASSSTVPGYRATYRGVETRPDLGHGVGAALLALTSRCEPADQPPAGDRIRQ